MKKIFLPVLCWLLCMMYVNSLWAQTGNADKYKYTFTVAKDGSGDYTFIQDAIDAMRVYPLKPITLYIKNGVYNEKILLPETNTDVSFIGESVENTIIRFNDYSGRGRLTTFTSYTARISGNRFYAQNITFENNAIKVGQAVALYVDADKAVFNNCRFLGNQDTMYASGDNSRQLFKNCYIEGTTDFIFGTSTAVFDSCTIFCKSNSYITAASTTKGKKFGFVFLNSTIKADSTVTKISLGRPWRAWSKTVFINCSLPNAIAPAGWDNWGNPENEKTVFYAEYKNYGPGAAIKNRVGWSKQLTAAEAGKYTLKNIFSGYNFMEEDEWYASTGQRAFSWPQKKQA